MNKPNLPGVIIYYSINLNQIYITKCQLITEKWLALGYASSHQALSADMFWKGKEILAVKEQILKGDCGEPDVILNKGDPFLLRHSSCSLARRTNT